MEADKSQSRTTDINLNTENQAGKIFKFNPNASPFEPSTKNNDSYTSNSQPPTIEKKQLNPEAQVFDPLNIHPQYPPNRNILPASPRSQNAPQKYQYYVHNHYFPSFTYTIPNHQTMVRGQANSYWPPPIDTFCTAPTDLFIHQQPNPAPYQAIPPQGATPPTYPQNRRRPSASTRTTNFPQQGAPMGIPIHPMPYPHSQQGSSSIMKDMPPYTQTTGSTEHKTLLDSQDVNSINYMNQYKYPETNISDQRDMMMDGHHLPPPSLTTMDGRPPMMNNSPDFIDNSHQNTQFPNMNEAPFNHYQAHMNPNASNIYMNPVAPSNIDEPSIQAPSYSFTHEYNHDTQFPSRMSFDRHHLGTHPSTHNQHNNIHMPTSTTKTASKLIGTELPPDNFYISDRTRPVSTPRHPRTYPNKNMTNKGKGRRSNTSTKELNNFPAVSLPNPPSEASSQFGLSAFTSTHPKATKSSDNEIEQTQLIEVTHNTPPTLETNDTRNYSPNNFDNENSQNSSPPNSLNNPSQVNSYTTNEITTPNEEPTSNEATETSMEIKQEYTNNSFSMKEYDTKHNTEITDFSPNSDVEASNSAVQMSSNEPAPQPIETSVENKTYTHEQMNKAMTELNETQKDVNISNTDQDTQTQDSADFNNNNSTEENYYDYTPQMMTNSDSPQTEGGETNSSTDTPQPKSHAALHSEVNSQNSIENTCNTYTPPQTPPETPPQTPLQTPPQTPLQTPPYTPPHTPTASYRSSPVKRIDISNKTEIFMAYAPPAKKLDISEGFFSLSETQAQNTSDVQASSPTEVTETHEKVIDTPEAINATMDNTTIENTITENTATEDTHPNPEESTSSEPEQVEDVDTHPKEEYSTIDDNKTSQTETPGNNYENDNKDEQDTPNKKSNFEAQEATIIAIDPVPTISRLSYTRETMLKIFYSLPPSRGLLEKLGFQFNLKHRHELKNTLIRRAIPLPADEPQPRQGHTGFRNRLNGPSNSTPGPINGTQDNPSGNFNPPLERNHSSFGPSQPSNPKEHLGGQKSPLSPLPYPPLIKPTQRKDDLLFDTWRNKVHDKVPPNNYNPGNTQNNQEPDIWRSTPSQSQDDKVLVSWKDKKGQNKADPIDLKLRQLRSILNKLTNEKFQSLYQQVLDLNIHTQYEMIQLTNMIFDISVTQHHFIELYANLCASLNVDLKNQEKDLDFRKVLLTQCEQFFYSNMKPMEKFDGFVGTDLFEKQLKYKRRFNGCVKLACQLYARHMLKGSILIEVIDLLMKSRKDCLDSSNGIDLGLHFLEALAEFLDAIGPYLFRSGITTQAAMKLRFEAVKLLAEDLSIPYRERCLLRNVIDDYEGGWGKDLIQVQEPVQTLGRDTENSTAHRNGNHEQNSVLVRPPIEVSRYNSNNQPPNHNTSSTNIGSLQKDQSRTRIINKTQTNTSESESSPTSIRESTTYLAKAQAISDQYLAALEGIADQIVDGTNLLDCARMVEEQSIPKPAHGLIWWQLLMGACRNLYDTRSYGRLCNWLLYLIEKNIFDSEDCQNNFMSFLSNSSQEQYNYKGKCKEIENLPEKMKIFVDNISKNSHLPRDWQSPSFISNLKGKLDA